MKKLQNLKVRNKKELKNKYMEKQIVKGQDINNVYQAEGKIYARLDWLHLWAKNPKIVEEKDLKRLKQQIKELGVYKPLLITPDGEILGGNQRYKCLVELAKEDEQYKEVWVSIVNAWSDEERLKYALSDNEQIGKYTRDKLHEVLTPFLEQPSLFKDYNLDITDTKSIDKFLDELSMTAEELKIKQVSKDLKELGINEETIKALSSMVAYNKNIDKLEDVELKGKIQGQKFTLMFWIEDNVTYEHLKDIFDTGHKDVYNTEKLIDIVQKQLGITINKTNE